MRTKLRIPRRLGLTLVDAIVAIGLIALIAGIAVPALSSVRLSSRASLCQSNLRQMGLAAHAYANVYEAFPPALQYEIREGVFTTVAWDWVIADGKAVSPGPLWQFTNDPHRVMQCPNHYGPSNAPGDPYTGYNYSVYLGGEAKFSTNPKPEHTWPGAKPHAVRRPAEVAIFGLGGWRGGANKFMRSPVHNEHSPQKLHFHAGTSQWQLVPFNLPLNVIYSGGQAFRYREATFVTRVDGHVATSRDPYKGKHATDALLTMFMGYPRNGFLSDDYFAYDPLR